MAFAFFCSLNHDLSVFLLDVGSLSREAKEVFLSALVSEGEWEYLTQFLVKTGHMHSELFKMMTSDIHNCMINLQGMRSGWTGIATSVSFSG